MFSLFSSAQRKERRTQPLSVSHTLCFEWKGAQCTGVCASNMSLCAQTLCPFTYQNDWPTIMWFNGKTHILLIQLAEEPGLESMGGKKNIIIQFLICLHKYERETLKKRSMLYGNLPHSNIGKQMCSGNVDGFLRSESHSCLASRSWLLLSFIFFCNVHRCCLIQLENVAMVLH